MKLPSVLYRYIFKELIPPFAINLVFLTFVFLMAQILDITNLIVNYNVGMFSVGLLLIYSMPAFLEFTIPMSVMMSVLVTFLRMSNENEIIALKAGGVNTYRLMPPVLVFSTLGFLATLFVTIYGVSWGNASYKKLAVNVATSSFEVGFKERVFNDSFDDVMLYVNKINMKKREFIDVFIEDQRDEKTASTVVAPKGKLFAHKGKLSYTLRLYNGVINQTDLKNKSVQRITFDTYEITLDFGKAVFKKKKKKNDEMSLSELSEFIANAEKNSEDYYSALMELYEKISIPFACIALSILAVPLGMQSASFKRSSGVGLGLIFFMMYYLMLAAGWSLGETGAYPPILAMWVPNIVMGGTGVYLLVQTVNEGPALFVKIYRLLRRLFSPLVVLFKK